MNFHYDYKFLSRWWSLIPMQNFHSNDDFWSKSWICITMMNFHYIAKFLHWSVLVSVDAELDPAQPQLVITILTDPWLITQFLGYAMAPIISIITSYYQMSRINENHFCRVVQPTKLFSCWTIMLIDGNVKINKKFTVHCFPGKQK